MPAESYFRSFRRALFTRGIMGQPAMRLMAEFRDHMALKQSHFLEAGYEPAIAQMKACEALGDPQVVAARAAETLQQGCWIARRPICFGLAFGLGMLVINLLIVIIVGGIGTLFLHDLTDYNWKMFGAQIDVFLLNWLPLFMGFGTLAWIAQFRAAGWKSLSWGACLLILSTSFLGIWIANAIPPPFVDHRTVFLTFESIPARVWDIAKTLFSSTGQINTLDSLSKIFVYDGGIFYCIRLLLTLAILPSFRYAPPLLDYTGFCPSAPCLLSSLKKMIPASRT